MIRVLFHSLAFVVRLCPRRSLFIVLCETLSALCLPLSLQILATLIDGVERHQFLWTSAALFAFTQVGLVALSYASRTLKIHVRQTVDHAVSRAWLRKCRVAPYSRFETPEALDVLTRAEEATDGKLSQVFEDLMVLVGGVIRLLGLVVVFAQTGIVLPVACLLVMAFILILDAKAISLMNAMFQGQSEDERRFKAYEDALSDRHILSFLSAVKGFAIVRDQVSALAKALAQARLKTTLRAQTFAIVSQGVIVTWFLVALVTLALAVFHGAIAIGVFVAAVSALSMALDVSERISVSWSDLGDNAFYLAQYDAWMAQPDDDFEAKDSSVDAPIECDGVQSIAFRDVSFLYPGTTNAVLRHLNVTLHGHERVALVGANGCGKSTLMKLLLGLYHPTEGEILINGRPLTELNRGDVKRLFSTVFQDYARFDLPIETNLHFDQAPDASHKVRDVLTAVGLNELALDVTRPLGKLDEGALDLSGGQWQKMALARALFYEGRYVLFDEPLSAVDPISEATLYEELMHLMGDRGCLLISHRLGSARRADRILVMDQGRIVEDGRHETLLAQNGLYAAMFHEQSRWYLDA